jgi:hypothetical protein
MTSRRWLLAFGLAIGVLIIVTVALVLTTASPGAETLLPEDTPEGTVQRFLLAVRDGDYLVAESYLSSEMDDKIAYDLRRSRVGFGEESGWKATLGESVVRGDEATVDVVVDVFRPGGPFENPVRTSRVTFFLEREGTSWSITSPLNLWWLY